MLVGITGMAGSGKDTVAELMVRNHSYTRIGLADPLKEAALRLDPFVAPNVRLSEVVGTWGWDRAKRDCFEVRLHLQRLGTEVVRAVAGDDVWVDLALRTAEGIGHVVIPDVRFDNEAVAIVRSGGVVYRVVRPGLAPLAGGHASEAGIPDGLVTGVIENSGSLEELECKVHHLFHHEGFAA